MATAIIGVRTSAAVHDRDSLQYRVIFALSFILYLAAGIARRVTPGFWRRAPAQRSLLAEAREASGTTARIAFSG